MDILHTILKWADYNRYQVFGLAVVVAVCLSLFACDATTASIARPGERVGRIEFQQEVASERAMLESDMAILNAKIAAFNAKAEAGEADLAEQEALRNEILALSQQAVTDILSGTASPASLVGLAVVALGFLGQARKSDFARKNSVIDKLKEENGAAKDS